MFGNTRAVAALVALAAVAVSGDNCGNGFYGLAINSNIPLATVDMNGGVQQYNVDIPPDSQFCPSVTPTHVGTSIQACDSDNAPVVTMTGLKHAIVTRSGNWAAETGRIYTNVYCA